MPKTGILLVNIGSPKSYEVPEVKKYLLRFLMDKDVLSIPFVFRWPLVNLLIVPKRAPFSAQNYKKVWMPGGSPLIVYSEAFRQRLQEKLDEPFVVKTGMSFSNPDIEESLLAFAKENVERILYIPLFPQYAEATTGAVTKAMKAYVLKHQIKIPIQVMTPFYKENSFVKNVSRIALNSTQGKNIEHYLFSYHGLPESQIRRRPACRINSDCCKKALSCEENCYRAQCFRTTEIIAKDMGLSAEQWSLSFQSRLGRAKWIGPSTEETLQHLGSAGVKRLAVLCPSFVADCIETLEEIRIAGRERFIQAGGEDLYLVPCVNDDTQWVADFADHCREVLNKTESLL